MKDFTEEDIKFIKEKAVYMWLNIQYESIYDTSKVLTHIPFKTALNNLFKVIEIHKLIDKDIINEVKHSINLHAFLQQKILDLMSKYNDIETLMKIAEPVIAELSTKMKQKMYSGNSVYN
jgi:hypothetical protein